MYVITVLYLYVYVRMLLHVILLCVYNYIIRCMVVVIHSRALELNY